MPIQYQPYEEKYRAKMAELFEEFSYYLIHIDPLKRLKYSPGAGEKILDRTLQEVNEKNGLLLLAVDGELVAGFAAGIIESPTEFELLTTLPTKIGRITELYTEALHRGGGIGSELMHRMEEYFIKQGCDTVKVEVFAPNEPARALYAKLGFQPRTIDNIKKLG